MYKTYYIYVTYIYIYVTHISNMYIKYKIITNILNIQGRALKGRTFNKHGKIFGISTC